MIDTLWDSKLRNCFIIFICYAKAMKQKLPTTTLFLLTSLDGKISTGDTSQMDFDKDLSTFPGTKKGLRQYYNLEKQTDFYSINSGKVFEKIGFNKKTDEPKKTAVNFVVIDNQPHLNLKGVSYVAKKAKKLIFVTNNPTHPAFKAKEKFDNIEIFFYKKQIDLKDMLEKLVAKGARRVTVQTGGELNAAFLRAGLINKVSIVIAPILVGGRDTPTLVDGDSLHNQNQLNSILGLKLVSCSKLANSYIHLRYKVLN
jgi:2,5-diamino-6-(ribosylamino)-4(3H)-pyrimidinone 5'-phosphate reductase